MKKVLVITLVLTLVGGAYVLGDHFGFQRGEADAIDFCATVIEFFEQKEI